MPGFGADCAPRGACTVSLSSPTPPATRLLPGPSASRVTTVTGATALNGGLTLDSNKFGPRLADEAIRELVEYTRTQAANGWAS